MFTHSNDHRTYAITRKNKWVAGILYAFATVLFVLGVYSTVHAAVDPGRYPNPSTQVFEFPN